MKWGSELQLPKIAVSAIGKLTQISAKVPLLRKVLCIDGNSSDLEPPSNRPMPIDQTHCQGRCAWKMFCYCLNDVLR